MTITSGSLAPGFIYGCVPSVPAPGNTVNITAGSSRDVYNTYDIVLSSNINVDPTVNGVNGLDTGTLQTSTMYAVYIIADTSGVLQPAGVISTRFDQPIFPVVPGVNTYNTFRQIGFVPSSNGSSEATLFVYQQVIGLSNSRKVYYDYSFDEVFLTAPSASVNLAIQMPLTGIIPPVTPVAANLLIFTTSGTNNQILATTVNKANTGVNPGEFSYFQAYASGSTNRTPISAVPCSVPISLGQSLGKTIPLIWYQLFIETGGGSAHAPDFVVLGYEYSI